MARSQSQQVLAAAGNDTPPPAEAVPGGRPWTAVFIVASPRPATGKTFLARLLIDFLRCDGAPVIAYELSPGDEALSDLVAGVNAAALDDTRAQMRLFDRLVMADGIAKVVDVGHAAFQRFFAVADEIGFPREAQRRGLEVIVLYAADAHPVSPQAYAILQRRLPEFVLVPVFNEATLKGRRLRDQYPFSRAAAVPVQVPLLLPALKTYLAQSGHSFADFHSRLPAPVPLGPVYELRSWTKRAFLEFRELELRLLMERLKTSLGV